MPTTPSWADLLEEHHREVIGPLWLNLLEHTVRIVTPRYPPHIYSETGEWNDHTRENLVQTVAVDQLLEQGQLAYIIATATSTDAAAALLNRIVRRTLGHARRRTVIDNLLDRSRALRTFAPAAGAGASTPTVLEAAREVARVPRLRIHSDERAPTVYSTESLTRVLDIAQDHLGETLSERDLARILEHVLTSYLPSALVQGDARDADTSPELNPDQEAVVTDVVERLLNTLTPEQRTILTMKLSDRSDTEVAVRIGVSRPTASKRFKEATSLIHTAVADLPTRLQDAVLGQLPTRLDRHSSALPRQED